MSNKTDFLTSIFAIVSPIGSQNDPAGKEGLMNALNESYVFKSKNDKNYLKLFGKLENNGAEFSHHCGKQHSVIYIRCPQSKINESKKLLSEMFEKTKIDNEKLSKIRPGQIAQIKELESSDHEYALIQLYKNVLGEEDELGNVESVNKIATVDFKSEIHSLKNNYLTIELHGAENYKINSNNFTYQIPTIKKVDQKPLTFIDREIEQKVLCLGVPTNGYSQFNYAIRLVANKVIHNDFAGLIMQKVREQNSAAYYAYASSSLLKEKGIYYMCCGVSEKKLTLSLKLLLEIIKQVVDGDFDARRLRLCKNASRGDVDQQFDNISSIFGFYSNRMLMNHSIPGYKRIIKDINSVTKKDVVDYYQRIFTGKKPSILINGLINQDQKDKCKKLLDEFKV